MPSISPPMIKLTRPSGIKQTSQALLGGMFLPLAKLAGAVAGLGAGVEGVAELVKQFRPDESPHEAGWRLVYAGLERAIDDTVKPFRHRAVADKPLPIEHLMQLGGDGIDFGTIEAPENFLDQPKSLPLLERIKPLLQSALIYLDVDEAAARAAADRLPGLFVFALEATWLEHKDGLAAINDLSKSPIALAARQERHWRYYRARLEQELENPLFAGDFSLRQVYQPLRGYWVERKDEAHGERQEIRHLVDLETALDAWLDQSDPKDALRVVTGGPGSGKSSFVKWWAWKVLQREELLPTLILPLHRFDSLDLEREVDKQRKLLRFARNPLDIESGEQRLLLILDGLDELDADDKTGREAASALVRRVDRLLERNRLGQELQIIIAGRELIVSAMRSELDRVQQIFHVVGYLPIKKQGIWEGDNRLFRLNQRQAWWRRWGLLTGEALPDAPRRIANNSQLADLCDQPLLNHLLAVTRARSPDALGSESSLNAIYAAMLRDVWQRSWGEGGQLAAVDRLAPDEFQRLFESIGLAVWQHGGGRTTTLARVAAIARQEKLDDKLAILRKGAEDGALDLLTAFYFRREGADDTFELTHKSFGEYFAALRLWRLIQSLHRQAENPEFEEGEGLRRWYRWTYAARITPEIVHFLQGELRALSLEEVQALRATLILLFNRNLRTGMALSGGDDVPVPQNFRQAQRFDAAAELALLVAIGACSNDLLAKSFQRPIEEQRVIAQWHPIWPNPEIATNGTDFQDMLYRLSLGEQLFYLAKRYLEGISVDRQNFLISDLSGSSIKCSSFVSSQLFFSNFHAADLSGSDLTSSFLGSSTLIYANLSNTNLKNADLSNANLSNANLKNANLKNANLKNANFDGVDLRQTYGLTKAQLAVARNLDWDRVPADLPEA